MILQTAGHSGRSSMRHVGTRRSDIPGGRGGHGQDARAGSAAGGRSHARAAAVHDLAAVPGAPGRRHGPRRTADGAGRRGFLVVASPGVPPDRRRLRSRSDGARRVRAGPRTGPPRSRSGAAPRIQELLLGFSRGISASERRRGPGIPVRGNQPLWHAPGVGLDSLPASPGAGAVGLLGPRLRRGGARGCRPNRTPFPARGLRLESPQFLSPAPDGERILVAPLRGWRRALGTVVLEGEPRELDEGPVRRRHLRFRASILVRARKRAAARRSPAAAAAARRHLQLAHRPGGRHRQQHAGRPDERRLCRARWQLQAGRHRPSALGAGRPGHRGMGGGVRAGAKNNRSGARFAAGHLGADSPDHRRASRRDLRGDGDAA